MRNLRGRKLGLGTGNLPAGHGAFGAGGQTTADQRRGGGAEMTMGAAHMLMTLPHPGPTAIESAIRCASFECTK